MKQTSPVPMTVFSSTFHKFTKLALEGNNDAYDAFALFVFFFECFVRQGRKRVYCTERFGMKHTGLGFSKYRDSKRLLRKMGLISIAEMDKKSNQQYFSMYLSNDESEWVKYEEWRKTEGYIDKSQQGGYSLNSTNNAYSENSILKQKRTTKSSKEDLSFASSVSKKKVLRSKFVKKNPVQKDPVQSTKSTNPVYKKIVKPVPKDKVDLGRTYSKINVGPVPKNSPPPKPPRRSEVDGMSANGFARTEPTQHVYLLRDKQLYNALVLLGATNHKKTRSYTLTMNAIHELLNPEFTNPYNVSKKISDFYKTKVWTQEEVIESFKFYLKTSDGKSKNIASFICQFIPGVPPFSPLVINHNRMMKTSTDTLEGDVKLLSDHLEGMRVGGVLDALQLKKVVSLIGVYCNGYKPKRGLEYMHGGNVIGVFTNYIQDKLRIASFKIGYIQGEKFIEEFVEESLKTGNLTY